MSGIAGILYRDGRPVQLEQLEMISKALAHRGKDGISYYCNESIGMIHCMLHDTPESLLETLPNAIDGGRLVITFHGRIDNREELKKLLDWEKLLSETTDSDLILAAYEKWGRACPGHLLGDFAFAIWDDRAQKLFCARDHMGVKPFYYYSDDAKFVFGSEIKGLLALNEIPRVLNEVRVADYLTGIVLDKDSTFYGNIVRLSPGHLLEIEPTKIIKTCYHEFTPTKLYCTTDREYEDQFSSIFEEAVRCRLRSAFPVGSYLSGGLDSAAIVCVAAGRFGNEIIGDLKTFSGIFDNIPRCDEREFFSPVLERYGLKSYTVTVDKINPAIAYEKLVKDEDEPFWAPHVFMAMELLKVASSKNIRILLDGHDGDAAVSYGYNLFYELAVTGKVLSLIRSYRDVGVVSKLSAIKKIVILYRNIIQKALPVNFCYSNRKRVLTKKLGKLNSNFAKNTQIRERLIFAEKYMPIFGDNEIEFHKKNVTQPIHAYALEFLERMTIRNGIVSRYPFFDKRVIEFCLALPLEQKFRNGFNRSIVRRSLKNVLPLSIRKRRFKTDFAESMLIAFKKNDRRWLSCHIDKLDIAIYDYLNEFYFSEAKDRYLNFPSEVKIENVAVLLQSVILSRWWQQNRAIINIGVTYG